MDKTLDQYLLQNKQNIKDLNGGIISLIIEKYLYLAILLLIATFVMFFVSVYYKNPGFFFIPLTIAALSLEYLLKKAHENFMRKFAQLNNYQYRQTGSIDEIDAPYLNNMGYNRNIRDVVIGNYENCSIKFFDFNCKISSDKSEKSVTFTACEIGFNATKLPHIFLDARHHFFTEAAVFASENHDADKNARIVKLEGDFNDYFTLYAPKEYEIETLQILAPDIMAELIDHSKMFSLEFFNNHLYIYSREAIDNGKNLYFLYSLALLLISHLSTKIERIKVK